MYDKGKKSFIMLLWSYVIIIIIPVIILGILTVGLLFARLASDTKKLNISILEQSKNVVDADMSTILTLFYQVMKNERATVFSSTKHNDRSIVAYEAWLLANEISLIQANNKIFENVGVYAKQNDVVVDKATAHTPSEYYDKYLKGSEYSYEQFIEILNIERNRPVFLSTRVIKDEILKDTLVFLRILDYVNKANSSMFIAVIDCDAIISKLQSVGIDNSFYFAMIDNEGNVLLKTDDSIHNIDISKMANRNGEYKMGKSSVFYRSSDVADLKYVYIFPKSGLKGNVGYVTWTFLSLLLVTIAISIILAAVNMKRTNKPILALFEENKDLTENLLERTLAGLLHNISIDETEQSQLFSKHNISFDMENICVMAVGCLTSQISEFNIYPSIGEAAWREINGVISSLMDLSHIRYYMVQTNLSNSIYILNYNGDEALPIALKKVLQAFEDSTSLFPCVGVGNVVSAVKEISHSYDGAVSALRYALQKGDTGGIVYYKDIQGIENNRVYYTNEKEHLLIRNIKTGSKESAENLLNEIYNVNFRERQLSQNTLRRLIFDISSTIYKVLDDTYTENNDKFEKYGRVSRNILRSDNLEESFEILKEICLSFCDDINNRTNSDDINKKITQYINRHYANKDLSLNMLAEHIDMNYYYLSRMFKEYMGTNFISYITTFRLKKAKELLEGASYSIEQIAEKTGFSSSNTFIKLFKKYYAVTPGKYKK
ncbi:MAG: helix-turn-helix transcriptional regulator [Firmicutes bacterium]|nr:helix-turn-helix transcriptional regulator [Bacillota bacterium]